MATGELKGPEFKTNTLGIGVEELGAGAPDVVGATEPKTPEEIEYDRMMDTVDSVLQLFRGEAGAKLARLLPKILGSEEGRAALAVGAENKAAEIDLLEKQINARMRMMGGRATAKR